MSDVWIPLSSALAGAAIGGAATAVGSIVVHRRQVAYDARATLHLDLLPDFEPSRSRHWQSDGPSTGQVIKAMRRTAVIAGRRDRHLADALQAAWDAREAESLRQHEKWRELDPPQRTSDTLDLAAEEEAVRSAFAALQLHVERKLR